MSHNPYDRALYDLLDATGQMCWDENRDYGAKYLLQFKIISDLLV